MDFLRKNKDRQVSDGHLAPGVRPIIAVLDDIHSLDTQTKESIDKIEKTGQFIDYDERDQSELIRKNIRNNGENSYLISDINENDKYSKRYHNCTGIAMVGIDRITGKKLSFLSHQNPSDFLFFGKEAFSEDLSRSISNMIAKCKAGTIDTVVFGGNDILEISQFKKSIKLLSQICSEQLGYEPIVLTGPNLESKVEADHTSVYLDTKNGRLYILRPLQSINAVNHTFLPSQMKDKSKNWERY